MIEVKIGATVHTVAPFSPRKVLTAGQMLKKVMGTVRQINAHAAEYRREYSKQNAEIITRAMSGVPPWRGLLADMTAEDWDRVGGQIELPAQPSANEIIAEVFPLAFEHAEDEVRRLLALVIIPNDELADAAYAGDAQAALDKYGNQILDRGSIGQVIDLMDVAVRTLREEVDAKGEALGRLRALFQTPQEPEAPPVAPSKKKRASSTPSPASTGGGTASASTRSRGGQPSPSPA